MRGFSAGFGEPFRKENSPLAPGATRSHPFVAVESASPDKWTLRNPGPLPTSGPFRILGPHVRTGASYSHHKTGTNGNDRTTTCTASCSRRPLHEHGDGRPVPDPFLLAVGRPLLSNCALRLSPPRILSRE
jgi:hypothetical protein